MRDSFPVSSVAPGRATGCLTQGLPRRQDVAPGPLQASVSLFHGSALATLTGPFNVCGRCGCVQETSVKQNPKRVLSKDLEEDKPSQECANTCALGPEFKAACSYFLVSQGPTGISLSTYTQFPFL